MKLFNDKNWWFSIGLYPGILMGVRSYDQPKTVIHVIYMPFIDIALEIEKQEN